jgi:hypothetical protein
LSLAKAIFTGGSQGIEEAGVGWAQICTQALLLPLMAEFIRVHSRSFAVKMRESGFEAWLLASISVY